MDTNVEAALVVHRTNGTMMKFQEFSSGLYYHDTFTAPAKQSSTQVIAYTFVSSVADNRARFTPREVEAADQARILYRKLGRPSQKNFENFLSKNMLMNCPVTVQDARRAISIYGPDVATLKGNTTVGHPALVPNNTVFEMPMDIIVDHKDVELCVDIFYVNKVKFFHTISRKIKFRTIAAIETRGKPTLLQEMQAVLKQYQSRGFSVVTIHCDNEFECLRNDVLPAQLNVMAPDDHQGDVERSIRTIKERVRSTIHGLPFRRFPKIMVKEIVKHAVKWLNVFPAKDGISDHLSPSNIVGGRLNPDFNKLKLEFGAYAQVFEPSNATNTPAQRTLGAIALNLTGNVQGDYNFMSLETGELIRRHKWTSLPITETVVARVEEIAAKQQQPYKVGDNLEFEWAPERGILDGPHDDELDEDNIDQPHILVEEEVAQGDNNVDIVSIDDQEQAEIASDQASLDTSSVQSDELMLDQEGDDSSQANSITILDTTNPGSVEEELTAQEDPIPSDADVTVGTDVEDEVPRYNLRPNRERDYSHKFGHPGGQVEHQFLQHVYGRTMTQMTAGAGIKKYGQPAVAALFAEYAQLEDKNVFEGVVASSLTNKQRRAALRAVNLIKEKRDGRLKGRTCADGRPQRAFYTHAQTTSPTISNDSLMLVLMTAALEGRDCATADVVGAYLHAKMEDFVVMRLTGEAVKIMCEVNSKYLELVTVENGRKVLYVRLLRALYGCVQSALLWYNLFSSVLVKNGFKLNPYDPCVANCEIQGKQCTVAWYVDDNFISHEDPNVVSDIIALIEGHFGKMTVVRGKKHTFLGMEFVFKDDKTVSIDMSSYLHECFKDFGEKLGVNAPSPAGRNLFLIDKTAAPLERSKSELFHSLVAKLLYISQRGRPDILLAVSFLCTRVSCSTVQDWEKLRRILKYLVGTVELVRVIGSDNMAELRTWVDASYAVHPDMRSHTGGVVSLGTGAVMCKSTKQKLNTKSSTEAEVVAASDYLPSTIWAKMFLEAQGHNLENNIFYQDNESAMKLESNGRSSAGQKSRHIDIRYFFITDRVKKEDLVIMHCPTMKMIADFFTKPLQGSLFRKLRDVIMGHVPISQFMNV